MTCNVSNYNYFCRACSDTGQIGGFVNTTNGYDSQDCPDCTPVAWRDPANVEPGQGCTYKQDVAKKWPHIYKQALYSSPQSSPLTKDLLDKAARAWSDKVAEECGVNKEDQWKLYSDQFKEDIGTVIKFLGLKAP